MSQPALKINDAAPATPHLKLVGDVRPSERRRFRRHELALPQLLVERHDAATGAGEIIGELADLSAGGVRVRTRDGSVRPGQTLSIRLQLPSHAGITPFVASTGGGGLRPACEWIGELCVLRRVERMDGTLDLGGQLIGMDDSVRGMLSLYLSTQPLAACA